MKIVKEYYKCDYCPTESISYFDFKYTDNSGLMGKCYDMCCDECFKDHLKFLKNVIFKNPADYDMNLQDMDISEYIKNNIWINGKSYHCKSDNAKELFENTIKWVKDYWDTIE